MYVDFIVKEINNLAKLTILFSFAKLAINSDYYLKREAGCINYDAKWTENC